MNSMKHLTGVSLAPEDSVKLHKSYYSFCTSGETSNTCRDAILAELEPVHFQGHPRVSGKYFTMVLNSVQDQTNQKPDQLMTPSSFLFISYIFFDCLASTCRQRCAHKAKCHFLQITSVHVWLLQQASCWHILGGRLTGRAVPYHCRVPACPEWAHVLPHTGNHISVSALETGKIAS